MVSTQLKKELRLIEGLLKIKSAQERTTGKRGKHYDREVKEIHEKIDQMRDDLRTLNMYSTGNAGEYWCDSGPNHSTEAENLIVTSFSSGDYR